MGFRELAPDARRAASVRPGRLQPSQPPRYAAGAEPHPMLPDRRGLGPRLYVALLRPPRWVGLANYAYLIEGDEYFWRFAVYNTLYMFLELPVAIGMGVGLAMLLNQRLRGMAVFRTIFYLPVLVPTVASALLWLWLLNPQYGLANQALVHLGLPRLGWLTEPRWSKPAFILMDLWGVG